jgi:tetratricopeptide (TPR) repeat protein
LFSQDTHNGGADSRTGLSLCRNRDALTTYEEALTLTPSKGGERALLHSNRAACLLREGKLTEAIKECGAALEAEPGFERALVRRARAYELAGKLDMASQDLAVAIKVCWGHACFSAVWRPITRPLTRIHCFTLSQSGGSAEALRCFQRVKSALMDVPKSLGGSSALVGSKGGRTSAFDRAAALGGASYGSSSNSSAAAAALRRSPQPNVASVKVTCENVIKTVTIPLTCTYADVLASVSTAFPAAGPLALRFVDGEGDTLTICSRADVRMCLHTALQRQNREYEEAAKAAQQAGQPPPRMPQQLPAMIMTAVPVAVSPLPPREELGADAESAPDNDIVEIDEWLLQLSTLWHTRLALPEGTAVDVNAIGMDACVDVLDDVIGTPEGQALLDAACAKFQEAAAAAMYQVGNVHHSMGRKHVDAAMTAAVVGAKDAYAAEHPDATSVPLAAIEEAAEKAGARSLELQAPHLTAAVAGWNTSLEIKPDYAEAGLAWGHSLFERAKLLAARAKEQPGAAECSVAEVDAAFQAAADKHAAVLASLPAAPPDEDAGAPGGEEGEGGAQVLTPQQLAAAELRAVISNARILWGNILFEHSQVRHARGDELKLWQPLVDQAVALFRQAKCVETDITRALEGHPSGHWKPAEGEGEAAAAKSTEE